MSGRGHVFIRRFVLAGGIWICGSAISAALTVELDNLQLLPPQEFQNTLDITLSGPVIGINAQQAELAGTVQATLELDVSSGEAVPTGITLKGGTITVSDVPFALLPGLVTATTTGIEGSPSTVNPPVIVTGGLFDAEDHQLTLDRGTVEASGTILQGTLIDLEETPIEALGDGTAEIGIQQVGAPMGREHTYDVSLELPLSINDSFDIDAPLVGMLTVDIAGTGNVTALERISLAILPGDFDSDGAHGCGDLELLAAEAVAGTDTSKYDVNKDGAVNVTDVRVWVEELRGTRLGDANLDGLVDDLDFGVWEQHVLTVDGRWCHADLNTDGVIDGTDFNIWNDNVPRPAQDFNAPAIPEPSTVLLLCCGVLAAIIRSRSITNP